MLGFCKPCLQQDRSRTFLCEDPEGRLIGVCVHELTNAQLQRALFAQFLIIVKQRTTYLSNIFTNDATMYMSLAKYIKSKKRVPQPENGHLSRTRISAKSGC